MPRIPLGAALVAVLAVAACASGASSSPAAPASQAASPATSASAGGGSSAPSGGGSSAACSPSTETATVDATIANFAFDPDPVEAKVGETVAWTNEDSAPHTATLDEGDCGTAELAQGATGALTFAAAGTYGYHCQIHPNMKGTIEVTE